MQRLIIVYNPRSSKYAQVEKEVLEPARKLGGYSVGKFEVKQVPVDENAARLAKILREGDLVIVAGGDGSATVGVNALMACDFNVTLGVIGYGNFNDMARMLGRKSFNEIITDFESGETQRLFPLEAVIDGKHFRYAACYFTVGMFAESTEVFDKPEVRGKLMKGGGSAKKKKGLVFSVLTLAKWYFKNRRKEFLPSDVQLNDIPMNRKKTQKNGKVNEFSGKQVSDVLFVNGKTVAKIMRGGDYWLSASDYLVSFGRLKGFFRLVGFMISSMISRVPGHKVSGRATKIDFSGPEEIEIQAEGEYKKVKLTELVVKKAEKGITVVV